ncbi:MAG: extracellular solute-binding protein [bacterium]
MMSNLAAGVARAAEPGPVTLQLWGMPEQDLFTGFAELLKEYEREHPEIRIERGTPGGQTELDPQKLMTAFVAGSPPDLVRMDRFRLAGWASRGVFLPLDDLFERDKIGRADFYPACLDECVNNGKVYGLPWNTDARALWANMAVLRQFGYSEPPKDWDELRAMGAKMTVRKPNGQIQTVGFVPLIGNSWLYMYGWLNGGQFTSADQRRITLTDARIVEALTWMAQVYKDIGGIKSVADFMASSQGEGIAEPFISGKIAMKIDGNWALDYVAKYAPDMDIRVTPPPPAKGNPGISWSGGFCWSIPANARHQEEAWALAKFLASKEGWLRAGVLQAHANERRARAQNLKSAYFIPQLSCSKTVNQAQIGQFAGALPAHIREAFIVNVNILDICKFRPVLPVGEQMWDEQCRAVDQTLTLDESPAKALADAQRRVQAELDKYYAPPVGTPYSIGAAFFTILGVVLAAGLAAWAAAAARWRWTPRVRSEAAAGLVFALPWLAGFLIFLLGPMLASLLMAFSEYNALAPARWVGLHNFRNMIGFAPNADGQMAATDPLFYKSLKNTFMVTAIGVPLGIVVSLGLALLVNREVRGARIYRTLFYLPVIVPTVATAILWMWLLNNETGLSGAFLSPVLRLFGRDPIAWFADPFYSRIAIVLMVTWGAGSSMVIWLAGLKNISATYYEAAAIDGAGKIAQFFLITLPLLTPYLFFNLIMGVIGWLQIFTQAYVLTVPPSYGPDDSLLFYVFYLFVQGFQYFKMGYACAMAWVLFVIVALLTLLQFKLAPRWVHYDQ